MRVILRSDSITGGPMVKLGTKWPSMTSRWIIRQPARSTSPICSPSREKSAARMDGRISTITAGVRRQESEFRIRLLPGYHAGEEAIAGIPAWQAMVNLGRAAFNHVFVLFFFQRASRVNQASLRLEKLESLCQHLPLGSLETN